MDPLAGLQGLLLYASLQLSAEQIVALRLLAKGVRKAECHVTCCFLAIENIEEKQYIALGLTYHQVWPSLNFFSFFFLFQRAFSKHLITATRARQHVEN